MRYPSARNWVRIRSESTRFLGQPRLTKPIRGALAFTDWITDGSSNLTTQQVVQGNRLLILAYLDGHGLFQGQLT